MLLSMSLNAQVIAQLLQRVVLDFLHFVDHDLDVVLHGKVEIQVRQKRIGIVG
jgi:hypothetical protein